MEWQETIERVYELLQSTLVDWFEAAVRNLPNLVVALVTLIIAFFLARLLRNTSKRVLRRTRLPDPILRIVGSVVYIATICVGLFISLTLLDLDKTVTSILAGAGVVGLALSFAFQDLASNFISGLFITLQRPLRVGDLVKTNDYTGHVENIGMRAVTIRDLDGQHVIIPSKDIFQNPLINYSTDAKRRVELVVGVTYASKLEEVEKIVREAIEPMSERIADAPLTVEWFEFGDSSINFRLRFWIPSSEQSAFNRARSVALKAVKAAFDANDITIPFPIRTIDFGIEGGQTAIEVAEKTLGMIRKSS